MGIDLKVVASHFRERRGEILATASLRFERDEALFALLTPESVPCVVRPLPPGTRVGTYEDTGLGFTDQDRHGRPLTFTTPADLAQVARPRDLSPWNAAILAFLLALPADAKVILIWC